MSIGRTGIVIMLVVQAFECRKCDIIDAWGCKQFVIFKATIMVPSGPQGPRTSKSTDAPWSVRLHDVGGSWVHGPVQVPEDLRREHDCHLGTLRVSAGREPHTCHSVNPERLLSPCRPRKHFLRRLIELSPACRPLLEGSRRPGFSSAFSRSREFRGW